MAHVCVYVYVVRVAVVPVQNILFSISSKKIKKKVICYTCIHLYIYLPYTVVVVYRSSTPCNLSLLSLLPSIQNKKTNFSPSHSKQYQFTRNAK